jgi:hypothetical protein
MFLEKGSERMRNKHRGALWNEQDGKCAFCGEPMEKWPYAGHRDKKTVRPRQAVKAHLYSRLADERSTDPTIVLAQYECQQKRSREDILVGHRAQHLIKTYMGFYGEQKK